MKNNKSEPIPVMDYRQYRRVRRLVHECCNYIDGNCIALDNGEECVCVPTVYKTGALCIYGAEFLPDVGGKRIFYEAGDG